MNFENRYLETVKRKETISSLELLEQINFFRKQEDDKTELGHNDLLKVIRDEFEEDEILLSEYKNTRGKKYPMFNLTLKQTKRLFARLKVKPSEEFSSKYNLDIKFDIITKTRFEVSFGKILKEALKELGVDVINQFNVDKYRVDFYIPSLNKVVEYDEQQHFTEANVKKDSERQECIEKKLGCRFVRCDYRDSDIKNLTKVLKEVM